MSISDNKERLKNLMKQIKNFNGGVVKVGIQNNAGFNENGESILDYAICNEFGTVYIPSRSFIRDTEEEKRDSWYKILQQQLEDLLDDNNPSALKSLSIVGLKASDDIKMKITNARYDPKIKPLEEATIKAKKSSSPLIDTGAMRNAVRYVIENI